MSLSNALRAASVALTVVGCEAVDCAALPCALPMAVELTVTDASTGGAVPGATVRVNGMVTDSLTCNQNSGSTVCFVPGGAGTYSLNVSAPGYVTAAKTVQVPGRAASGCGCATAQTQRATVALARV